MKKLKKIFCKNRKEWRAWLQRNHLTEKVVWLVYYKKHTNKESIQYIDAVEEAICYGWIDGQVKRIDDEKYMQRYTPRRTKSRWSAINIQRANRMIEQGYMKNEGLKIFQNGIKNNDIVPTSKNFSVPTDLKSALGKNEEALRNFQKFAPSAKLAYVYWVNSAKTDKTRQKRIKHTIVQLDQNKKFGEK